MGHIYLQHLPPSLLQLPNVVVSDPWFITSTLRLLLPPQPRLRLLLLLRDNQDKYGDNDAERQFGRDSAMIISSLDLAALLRRRPSLGALPSAFQGFCSPPPPPFLLKAPNASVTLLQFIVVGHPALRCFLFLATAIVVVVAEGISMSMGLFGTHTGTITILESLFVVAVVEGNSLSVGIFLFPHRI